MKNKKTTRGGWAIVLSSLVSVIGGCDQKSAAPVETQQPPAKAVSTHKTSEPMAQLYAMDTRQAVPLQPMMAWHQKQNMMEHLVAIQRITGGLAQQDWSEVATAAALIESSPQMRQMCQHMGAGAEGFTELALEFHRRADGIGEAARGHDTKAVLLATSNTLQACTSCHATYRQEVVSAATWQERTGASHAPMGGHAH